MYHRLRDGLGWCICDQQAVFLDLQRDRYFRLRPEDDKHFQRWAGSGALDPAELARLVGAGVIIACDRPQPPSLPARIEPPVADLTDGITARARLIDIGRCVVAQHRATSLIRHGRLAACIAALSRDGRAGPARADGAETIARIAAGFASAPLALRKAGQCLPRAVAANALCRAAGVATTLVFGVQLQPFGAHCWLQWGARVVVGDVEHARMFTPILAVS